MQQSTKPVHESPRLLGAGRHVAPPGRDFPRHEHRCWELVYYVSGRADCPIGDEVYAATPGTVLATPPRTPHAELTTSGYANRFLQLRSPLGWPVPRICFDDGAGSLGRIFEALVREFVQPGPDSPELTDLLLGELDIRLRRAARASGEGRPSGPSESERIVAEAERLLEQRFAGGVRVADVARELGVSPSTLRGYFARHRAAGPRTFLRDVRLRHALGYLRNSTLTLHAIAELTGYDSVSHLSRCVKAATGLTPGRLRARVS